MKTSPGLQIFRQIRQRLAALLPLALFVCCMAGSARAQEADRKFALLIGISDYPKEGGWQTINSTNDLVVMADVLQKRGFAAEHIFMVKNQEATRAGILSAIDQDLLRRVRPGDVVYFQFSGHGQQVADDNGDELDGYDEAIVPFDSPLHYKPGVYEGENLIRDDELNNIFTDLRGRLGAAGNLLVVLDACHSGTGTRGMEPARGTDIPMADDAYIQSAAKRPTDGKAAPQFNASAVAVGQAPMVAFFGSAQNQLNYEARDEEGRLMGSLTYALSKKLGRATTNTTYRGLFDQVRTEMSAIAPRQQPQAEGTLDQELLGGRLHEQPDYFHVVRWNDPGSVAIDAGWVQGLNEGAVLGLYPAETRDPATATPLARGTVSAVSPFEATLNLDVDLNQEAARETWAYILEQNFGKLTIGLSVQLPAESPLRSALQSRLASYPMIHLEEAPELFIAATADSIQLVGHGDMLLENLSGSLPATTAAERLLTRILAYTQAKYLRQLDSRSSLLDVTLELLPVRLAPDGKSVASPIPVSDKVDSLGVLHFQRGDAFQIKVVNNGTKTAYFTLLDIQPDNMINVLIPARNETPSEFLVRAGDTLTVNRPFRVGPPAGVEMFKLIATNQAVDLRPIQRSRGAATRDNAPKSPLETLFGQTYFNDDVRSRGGNTVNLGAGTINVQSFTFIID